MTAARLEYQKHIENRISGYHPGYVFSAADFLDISDTNAINQALHRLCDDGEIRRVFKGLYDKPAYSSLLQEYSAPRVDLIANALARKFNWKIAPGGDAALNVLHVSTQVPTKWEYVSDGPYREYQIGKAVLNFKHAKSREINNFSPVTVIYIQAIRAIGKGQITEEDIERLTSALKSSDKEILLKEGRAASGWVYQVIQRICREKAQQ